MNDLDPDLFKAVAPFLWDGLQTSFGLLLLAMAGGGLLGTILAVMRIAGSRPIAAIAAGYVNGLRSVPLIMVIFWFYLLVPLVIGRPIGAFTSALIAFVIFEAAYYAEIIRAGIQSVPKQQLAAALASGLGPFQAYRFVILPQAIRKMLPILLSQSIALFQDTSLVYVVGLHDFMTAISVTANRDGHLVEFYLFAVIVYFTLCFAASQSIQFLNRSPLSP
ncbi:glutamate/aspartate transport system permease protein [Bradyrhizobium sp. USDA 4472]